MFSIGAYLKDKRVIGFSLGMGLFVVLLAFQSMSFQFSNAEPKRTALLAFTARSLSLVEDLSIAPNFPIGGSHMVFTDRREDLMQQIGVYDTESAHIVDWVMLDFNGIYPASKIAWVTKQVQGEGVYYAYYLIDPSSEFSSLNERLFQHLVPSFTFLFVILCGFLLYQWNQLRTAQHATHELSKWLYSLANNQHNAQLPNLKYKEFNHLALSLHHCMQSMNDVLNKQQSFSAYTSHELKGSMAVLSSNLQLFEILMSELPARERSVLTEMDSALTDMKLQMEGVYLLTKNVDEISYDTFELKSVIDKSLDSSRYLLKHKSVTVVAEALCGQVSTNLQLFQLLVNNIIRNAFQHAADGVVLVSVNEAKLSVTNQSSSQAEGTGGYGIGLEIVERIAATLKMEISVTQLSAGREVQVYFPSSVV